MRTLPITAAAFLVLATGCGERNADDYSAILPDDRVLVSLPVDFGGSARSGEYSDFYLFTAQVTEEVNGLIGGVLHTVDHVTSTYEPTWSSTEYNTAVWGPWAEPLDPVETLLWVHYEPSTDVYTWGIDIRSKGSEDAWKVVVAGQVNEGATRDDADGWFAVDFTAINALDPTSKATGRFLCGYDLDADGVVASAGFDEFAEDAAMDPVSAYYHYEQAFGGDGLMDLVFTADVANTGSGAEELVAMRSRWVDSGAGRSDAVVTGGDLGLLVGAATECWDESFGVVYSADNWGGGESGDEADCAFGDASYNETAE